MQLTLNLLRKFTWQLLLKIPVLNGNPYYYYKHTRFRTFYNLIDLEIKSHICSSAPWENKNSRLLRLCKYKKKTTEWIYLYNIYLIQFICNVTLPRLIQQNDILGITQKIDEDLLVNHTTLIFKFCINNTRSKNCKSFHHFKVLIYETRKGVN